MTDPQILAIECSDRHGSFAVLRGRRVLAHSSEALGKRLSVEIVPRIQAVLNEAGLGLNDLEVIGVTVGPGSFTGLRVGLATVKGLVAGTPKIQVAPVGTLDALALGVGADGLIGAALDARRGEVFAGLYRCAGAPGPERTIECVEPPVAIESGEWARGLARRSEGIHFVGGGALVNRESIATVLGERACFHDEEAAIADARMVGELARRAALEGEFADAEALTPSYIQVSQYARVDGTLG